MKNIIVVIVFLVILFGAGYVIYEGITLEMADQKTAVQTKNEASDRILMENARTYLNTLKEDIEYQAILTGENTPVEITNTYEMKHAIKGTIPDCILLTMMEDTFDGNLYYGKKVVLIKDSIPVKIMDKNNKDWNECIRYH